MLLSSPVAPLSQSHQQNGISHESSHDAAARTRPHIKALKSIVTCTLHRASFLFIPSGGLHQKTLVLDRYDGPIIRYRTFHRYSSCIPSGPFCLNLWTTDATKLQTEFHLISQLPNPHFKLKLFPLQLCMCIANETFANK